MDQLLSNPPEQLGLILDNVADGITAQAPDGSLIYANDAAAVLSGFKSGKEMQTAPVGEIVKRFALFDEEGKPLSSQELPGNKALRTGETSEREVRFQIL